MEARSEEGHHLAFSSDADGGISLADEVTIVLATSFIEACPATNLIEAVVESFGFVPGLDACRLVVVCDGYLLSTHRRTKAGRLIADDEAPYAAYIAALRALAGAPGARGAWAHASVLALDGHQGFSWAIKAALESGLVETRHVLVVQHDRSFMRSFDLARAVRVMRADERVRRCRRSSEEFRRHSSCFFLCPCWVPQ